MNINLGAKILLMFGVLMVISIGNIYVLLAEERDAAEQQGWVVHTHKVIAESEAFLGHMRDAETGQRGYLLTLEPAYLEPYMVGVERASGQLGRLKDLTSDNPLQQSRLDAVHGLMIGKFAELAETVQLGERGEVAAALTVVRSDNGKEFMDAIRLHFKAFKDEEERLLGERQAAFDSDRDRLQLVIYVEAAITLLLVGTFANLLQRTLVKPLVGMTANAERVAAGEAPQDVPVVGGDEISRLATAFNKMYHDVRDRTAETNRQAHFHQSFSHAVTACFASRDLAEALSDALIVHAFHHDSPVGAIYLYDEETGQLTCAVAHGASDEMPRTVPVGTGLVGQVYVANETLVVGADSAEGFHIDAGLATIEPRAVVLQPIGYSGNMLGVLVLTYTIEPTEQDLQYVANLADQFGIAVMSARQYAELQDLTQELEESRREILVQRDEAVQLSITDPLTGLYNRGYLQVELERLIQSSARYKTDLSMIIFDIDHFKSVNDQHGHQAGDEVLRIIGSLLKRDTRASDMAVRYGGEEFVIILPETNEDEAAETAEKLRKAVADADIPVLSERTITISLGVATLGAEDQNMDSMVGRADAALYRAKGEGRNRVCVAEPA
jgi:diguanylate cyclase (GGDEF)-like protein